MFSRASAIACCMNSDDMEVSANAPLYFLTANTGFLRNFSRASHAFFWAFQRKLRCEPCQSFGKHERASFNVVRSCIFVRRMAVSLKARNKEHCRRGDTGHEKRVV